jgi:hypothetical protein
MTNTELDDLRKERLKQALNNTNPAPDPEPDPTPAPDFDEESERIFQEQFQGDPAKAVKSWREAQSAYNKTQNKLKESEQYLNQLDSVLEKNPTLAELIKKANAGEDVEKIINKTEPLEGKPQPTTKNDVSVEELIFEGYLDKTEMEFLTAEQRAYAIRQAKLNYIEDTLPKRAAEKVMRQIEEAEQEKRLREQQTTNRKLTEERYNKGIETVLEEYELDFKGEHEDVLTEINKRVRYMADPDNPNVISEDAVYLATQAVLRNRNITPKRRDVQEKVVDAKKTVESMYQPGFNYNGKPGSTPNKPKTIADKLAEKKMERYQSDVANRLSSRTDIKR